MKVTVLGLLFVFGSVLVIQGGGDQNTATVVSSRRYDRTAIKSGSNLQIPNIFRPFKRVVRRILGLPVYTCILVNKPADVTALSLSRIELISETVHNQELKTAVSTEHADPEGDVVTFNYEVTAGKIVGQGAKVTWDFTGVPPGTYTITAWVNDGCGKCGEAKTRRIEILECAGCMLRETE